MTLAEIKAAADALTFAEKADFALHSWYTLEDEPQLTPGEWRAAWAPEWERRRAETEAGLTVSIPGEEVFRMLRERRSPETPTVREGRPPRDGLATRAGEPRASARGLNY